MKRLILSATGLALVLALGLIAAPAEAVPQSCAVKCTPSTPNYIVCSCPFGFPSVITCGEYRTGGCAGGFLTESTREMDFADIAASSCAGATLTADSNTAAGEASGAPKATEAPAAPSDPAPAD